MKNNMYQESDSIVLNLESLSTQYKNLLVEYEQAVSNYVNYLKEETSPQSMVTVKGSTFWGTNAITQNNSATLEECQASCSSTKNCTGATFNQTANAQPICWLRSGNGSIITGADSDYAIISKGLQLLSIIQNINQQLQSINKQIETQRNQGKPLYDSAKDKGKLQNVNLIKQFINLTRERENIDKMIDDYQTLVQKQDEGSIIINKNYYSFILLFVLVILIIFILSKYTLGSSSSGELGISTYFIIAGIILVAIFIYFFTKS